MNQKYIVTIFSMNKQEKTKQWYVECDTMQDVTRVLLTYKPLRGYEIVHYEIDPVEQLV